MRSHGGVETMLEVKTFLFWKPTSFKSHETRILSGGICFGLCSKDDLNFALKTLRYVWGLVGLTRHGVRRDYKLRIKSFSINNRDDCHQAVSDFIRGTLKCQSKMMALMWNIIYQAVPLALIIQIQTRITITHVNIVRFHRRTTRDKVSASVIEHQSE